MQNTYWEDHPDFFKYFKFISQSWYIRGLSKHLHSFIYYCCQCLTLQIRRHQSYKSLQTIQSLPMPFFIMTLDFILAFLLSIKGFNAHIFVICKFSIRVILIPGIDIWTAKELAHNFFKRLYFINRGLQGNIITDQDSKFLSQYWIVLFHKFGVCLLYSTAYYLQIVSSSEKTNQIVTIAIRFFVHALKNPSF